MRTVLITLSTLIALAIWLMSDFRVTAPGVGTVPAADSDQTALRRDDRARVEAAPATTSETHSGRPGDPPNYDPAARRPASTLPFSRTPSPRVRRAFTDYLIESGLSESDSRNVADAAMAELGKCLQAVFSPGDTFQKGPVFLACKQNVLQQHGLLDADIDGSIYGP